MPSPVGHVLAGLALGLAFAPAPTDGAIGEPPSGSLGDDGRERSLVAALQFVPRAAWIAGAVAAAPDLDLLVHQMHRGPTHSLVATALVMIVAAGVTGKVTGRVDWRWVLLAGAAQASHILLDWLGTDRFLPYGIQALWPYSDQFYISGWDIFPPTERRIWLPEAYAIDLRAVVTEIVLLGPLALAGWLTRTGRTRARSSVRGARRQPSA
jgi:inner membrane protein